MRIGVDLGGTKIEVIALNERNETLLRRRIPTPAGYDSILGAIAALVWEAERELGARASVGIGTPGAACVSGGLMKNANSTVLIGKPLQRDVETRLGRTVRMTNDANCLVLSESADGAAAGEHVVFGVICGTGVGGGIAIDGRILEGPNRIAGEWGHNPLPWLTAEELPGPAAEIRFLRMRAKQDRFRTARRFQRCPRSCDALLNPAPQYVVEVNPPGRIDQYRYYKELSTARAAPTLSSPTLLSRGCDA